MHGILRGIVGAMAMTGVRVLAKDAGLIREDPPRRLTRKSHRRRRRVVAELAHWGLGGALGALYALLPEDVRRRRWSGPLYGLLVWIGFDAVISPALGLTERRWPVGRERAVFVADHLLFGAVVGQPPD